MQFRMKNSISTCLLVKSAYWITNDDNWLNWNANWALDLKLEYKAVEFDVISNKK